MKNQFDILISILTIPEVNYLAPIAKRLIDSGNKIGFILFHEGGIDKLEELGIPYFNVFEIVRKMDLEEPIDDEYEKCREEFGIANYRHLYLHELLGYGRKNQASLSLKVYKYLKGLDKVLNENSVNCVMQEFGGFSSNHCVYHAARKNCIDHVFYEGAPFKKRIIFNLNSYYSELSDDVLKGYPTDEAVSELKEYIEKYKNEQSVVIPFKDNIHFADQTLGKIINSETLKRLKRKLVHKYIEKRKEEYDEIGYVVKYAFVKFVRRLFLGKYYVKEPDLSAKYFYYPFHVPHDSQLTSRSRLFYFQEALVEYLCRTIPHGYKLYIKEHPASVGAQSFSVLRRVLRQYDNLELVHPMVNSFEIIKNAEAVISVNSKVGFESLMQNKKVIVLGDVFYKNKGVTFDCENLNDLCQVIKNAIKAPPLDPEKVFDFLARTFIWSYPSEMFFIEEKNMEVSYNSFASYLRKIKKIK